MNSEFAVSTQFLTFWIGWALVGLAGGVAVFLWSVRTGQYTEDRRAGMLPLDGVELDDLDRKANEHPKAGRGHFHLIMGIVVVGVVLVILSVVFSIMAPAPGEEGRVVDATPSLQVE